MFTREANARSREPPKNVSRCRPQASQRLDKPRAPTSPVAIGASWRTSSGSSGAPSLAHFPVNDVDPKFGHRPARGKSALWHRRVTSTERQRPVAPPSVVQGTLTVDRRMPPAPLT